MKVGNGDAEQQHEAKEEAKEECRNAQIIIMATRE